MSILWDVKELPILKAKLIPIVWNIFFFLCCRGSKVFIQTEQLFWMSLSPEILDNFPCPTEMEVFFPFTSHLPACRQVVSWWVVSPAVQSMLPVPKCVRGEGSEGNLKLVESQEKDFSLPPASTTHCGTLHHYWRNGDCSQSFPSTYPGAVSFSQKHPVVLGTCCVEVDSEDSLRGQRHSGFSVSCTGTRASSELPLMLITVTVSEFELSTLKRSSLWISWLLALLLPKPALVFWRHTRQFGDFDSWIWVI